MSAEEAGGRRSQQRLLEQDRAREAWRCVQEVRSQKCASSYGSLARSAPADIQISGLGQTLAFWRAKGFEGGRPKGNEHSYLLEHVSGWIRGRFALKGGQDLVEWIVNEADTGGYRRATAEAMAFLTWVKRFAEAELRAERGEGG